MESPLLLALIVAAMALICLAVFFVSARRKLKENSERLEYLHADLQTVRDANARVEQEVKRLADAKQQVDGLRQENTGLREELAKLQKEIGIDQENIERLQAAEKELYEAFKVSASEALQGNADQFLIRVRAQLGSPGAHLEKKLEELNKEVREMVQEWESGYDILKQHLKLAQARRQLQATTGTLVEALNSSAGREKWGGMQLRRVLEIAEIAGITEHVDFNDQPGAEPWRPDMLIHLPDQGILPVDAKTPMEAYLEAMEAADENQRELKLKEQARALRQRIQELGDQRYWEQFKTTPEFVAMFVPNDGCLSAVFERDPELLVFAVQKRVLPTTLITLLALLSAVAYGWQKRRVAENAEKIAAQGKGLVDRLSAFASYAGDLGTCLDQAIAHFFGSLENRFLPTAIRIRRMGAKADVSSSPATADDDPDKPAA